MKGRRCAESQASHLHHHDLIVHQPAARQKGFGIYPRSLLERGNIFHVRRYRIRGQEPAGFDAWWREEGPLVCQQRMGCSLMAITG